LCFDFADGCDAYRVIPSANAEIVERTIERCGAVFVKQLAETPTLGDSVGDTNLRGYILDERLYVDFHGLILPVAIARALADALLESLQHEVVRVRSTPDAEWHEVLLAGSSYEFY
jgi:hypothetical protein